MLENGLIVSNYLFFVGIMVEAMSAAISSSRRNFDIMGAILIGNITAFGGGTVRDILLDRFPLLWVTHPTYLVCTTIGAILALGLAPIMNRIAYQIFLYLDALGLVAFAILTTKITLDLGLSPVNICIFAMIAGICGGMLRDILCNEIPLVFHKELYALVALVCSILYQVLIEFFPAYPFSVEIITIGIGFTMRAASIHWHITLPKLQFN